MPPGIGYSFMPGADQQNGTGSVTGRTTGGAGSRVSSPASSIKVLNLRLPSRENPRAPAPQSLLTAAGAAGAPAGFDPNFINLLANAFAPPIQSQNVSQSILSGSGGGGDRRESRSSGRQSAPAPTRPSPFDPQPPATPEFVGDVPQDVPGLFDPNEYNDIINQLERERRAEKRASGWADPAMASFMANQAVQREQGRQIGSARHGGVEGNTRVTFPHNDRADWWETEGGW